MEVGLDFLPLLPLLVFYDGREKYRMDAIQFQL